MLCERCGNEFERGKTFEKEDGKKYIKCPYCDYVHEMVRSKKKNSNKKRYR